MSNSPLWKTKGTTKISKEQWWFVWETPISSVGYEEGFPAEIYALLSLQLFTEASTLGHYLNRSHTIGFGCLGIVLLVMSYRARLHIPAGFACRLQAEWASHLEWVNTLVLNGMPCMAEQNKEMAWLPPRAIPATSCAQKGHSLCFQQKLWERHEVPPRNTLTKVALRWAGFLWGWDPTRVYGRDPILLRSAPRAHTKHGTTRSHDLCWIWDVRLQFQTPNDSCT